MGALGSAELVRAPQDVEGWINTTIDPYDPIFRCGQANSVRSSAGRS